MFSHNGSQPSVSDTHELSEELERLEQQITLTLQEIDHNFSRAHRIVTTGILPVIGQYAQSSAAVWEGSKFWKGFFEASANVELNKFEESAEEEEEEEEVEEEYDLAVDDDDEEEEVVEARDEDEDGHGDSFVGDIDGDGEHHGHGMHDVSSDPDDPDDPRMSPTPVHRDTHTSRRPEQRQPAAAAAATATATARTTARPTTTSTRTPLTDHFGDPDLSDSSLDIPLDAPQLTVRLDLGLDGTFGGATTAAAAARAGLGRGNVSMDEDSPSIPKTRYHSAPADGAGERREIDMRDMDMDIDFEHQEAQTPFRQFDSTDLVLSSSPMCTTPMTGGKSGVPQGYSRQAQAQAPAQAQYRSTTDSNNPTSTTTTATNNNNRRAISGPVHRIGDRNFRVVATPLKQPGYGYSRTGGTTGTISYGNATPAGGGTTQQRADWLTAVLDSPDSPELVAPVLRSEMFGYLNTGRAGRKEGGGGGGGGAEGDSILRGMIPRTPGISVQTPGRRRAATTPATTANKANYNRSNLFGDLFLDDEDEYDTKNGGGGGAAAASPPKTMQFHLPQSRILQTPAREASRRIVNDLLLTAGARAAADPDTARRTGLRPGDTNLFGRRGGAGGRIVGGGGGGGGGGGFGTVGLGQLGEHELEDSILLDSTFGSAMGIIGGDTLSRFANIDPARNGGAGLRSGAATTDGGVRGPSSGGLFSPAPAAAATGGSAAKYSGGNSNSRY